jgi:hypothetical protein
VAVFSICDEQEGLPCIAMVFDSFQSEVNRVKSAVMPRDGVKMRWFCKRAASVVNVAEIIGRVANSTRKYSSSRFPAAMNVRAASRAFEALSFILPLESNMTPTLGGTSSWEKYSIFCSSLSSQTWKRSGPRPVTKRPCRSETVTLSSARSTLTLRTMLLCLQPGGLLGAVYRAGRQKEYSH